MGRKSLEQIIKTVGLVAGAVVGCVTGGYFGYVSGTVNIENAEEYFSALKSVIPYYPAVAAAWLAILGGIIG